MTTIIREVPSTPKPLPTPKKPSTKTTSPNEKIQTVVDNNDNGIDSGSIRILPTPTVAATKNKRSEIKDSGTGSKVPRLDGTGSVTQQDRRSRDSNSSANSSPRKSNKPPAELIVIDLNQATRSINNEETQKEVTNITTNINKINEKHSNALELFLDNISSGSSLTPRRGSDTPTGTKDAPLNTKGANYLFQRWKKRVESDRDLINQEKLLMPTTRKKSS